MQPPVPAIIEEYKTPSQRRPSPVLSSVTHSTLSRIGVRLPHVSVPLIHPSSFKTPNFSFWLTGPKSLPFLRLLEPRNQSCLASTRAPKPAINCTELPGTALDLSYPLRYPSFTDEEKHGGVINNAMDHTANEWLQSVLCGTQLPVSQSPGQLVLTPAGLGHHTQL